MPLNRDLVGRCYPASAPYEVSREKIRDFAAAIGEESPAVLDPDAAKALGHPDVVAPPTFLTLLSYRFAADGPLADPALGLDFTRVVHGEQRFVHHRPVRAGDVVTVTARIDDIRTSGRNELMVVAAEVATESGEPVAAVYSTIVSRGTAAPAS